ncbi:Alpha/Beta hydrolase protein [Aspergillus oleicola]
MHLKTRSLLLVPYLLGQVLASANHSSSTSVNILNGTVLDVNDEASQVQRFLGIPYAQPPVGDLRLRQSIPLKATFGTLEAQSFGPACYGPEAESNPNSSENCLTLNVWRGSGQNQLDALKPVMVWFYGGGLQTGYTADPRFEGTNIVRISSEIGREILLVSVENIAAFGGDPGKVTVAGESAGAVSGYSHMMAYGGRNDNLFRAGILESGGSFPLTYANTSSFQATFDSLITGTACKSFANTSADHQLDSVRKLPIETFLSSVGSSTGQSIDGSFTQTSLQFALEAGKYVKVATIVGTNTDEETNSAPTGINTTEKLDKKACSIFGDIVQIAPARMIAKTLSRKSHKENGDPPIYRYRFNHLPSDTAGSNLTAGIGTGVEQRYVFSNLVPGHPWDTALAEQVSRAWVSFVWGLDPNVEEHDSQMAWYGTDGKSMVFSGYGSSIEKDDYRAETADYIIENVLPYGAL